MSEHLARYVVILTMLLVNLITAHRCSRGRYSLMRVIGEMTLFTAFVFLVSFLIRSKFEVAYLNSIMIILIGFTYYFPLKHVYDESSDRILAIMFFSWIHTMTVMSLSLQISKLLGYNKYFITALLIQSLIYLISTPLIIRFINNKFLYILRNISDKMNRYLLVLSLIQYMIIVVISLYINEHVNFYFRIIMLVFVTLTTVIGYHLIYIVVKSSKNINILQHLAYSDPLTGIKNRLALYLDCDELIAENKPFTFIYMDLNNFKNINDAYGHTVGDDYLKQFVEATTKAIGDKGSLYRMSGDEFICVYIGDKIYDFLAIFSQKILNLFEMNIPFLGVSIGYVNFPEDADSLDKLIEKADAVMYRVKNKRR
ncbi:GGDEF domain-containing protein [Desulfosporosinus sp.]|uniref:GGDEF domain-containing protein n=1 Tax=Desulfosporosinus sp. TaxID=157907 RepID=UPI0025C20537|nr:GGDEF domain-containing protein [Desulfosporosinus sp.]MBC2721072.1 GGDEF domain-containing protein [Desulfosporosinus sp.]MBC2725606.1 GGDEF domain-containing protein [Desulfosporosinus sp.]